MTFMDTINELQISQWKCLFLTFIPKKGRLYYEGFLEIKGNLVPIEDEFCKINEWTEVFLLDINHIWCVSERSEVLG